MAGMSQREYNELVDEALVLFGGGAPCCNIDSRLWAEFKEQYKEFNDTVPKTVDWSYDQVVEWLDEYLKSQKEQENNK
jgi:hypothetical protein